MKCLLKHARNELVYGVLPEKKLEQSRKAKVKTRKTMAGARIGYRIPATIEMGKALTQGRKAKLVNFRTVLGSALGAVIGRHS